MGRRYEISTPLAWKFWGSQNVCNRVKAICAFSYDKEDANLNLMSEGYGNDFRKRVINSPGIMFNNPSMVGIPFNEGSTGYTDCLNAPLTNTPSVVWDDTEIWKDSNTWDNFIYS